MNEQGSAPQKGDILVVDDNPADLRLLTRILSREGYNVRTVTSGGRALEAVATNPPDLILLDIVMPEMNGYEVCEHLKSDESNRDIPIIFLSALDSVDDRVKAFPAGGVDYVTKPFPAEEVLARVQTHLAMRKLQKSLRQEIAELDAYAHTVAHDLKSPLGLVAGYADYLAMGWDTMSRQEILESAERIAQNAHKLVNIVDSLLLLASAHRRQVKMVPLDMALIVKEAQQRLGHMIKEYQAQLILPETWPTALGHAPWVEEVWANYVSNAVKHGGRPPRVEVGGRDQGDGTVRFWVRVMRPVVALDAPGGGGVRFSEPACGGFLFECERRGTGWGCPSRCALSISSAGGLGWRASRVRGAPSSSHCQALSRLDIIQRTDFLLTDSGR